MFLPRHVSFPKDKRAGENARDTNAALEAGVRGRYVNVERYSAANPMVEKLRLASSPEPGVRAQGVLLIRARKTYDQGAFLATATVCSFFEDANGINVYEPNGLAANTFYDLTFLILE